MLCVKIKPGLYYAIPKRQWFKGSAGKESSCNAGDPGSIPGWGGSAGKGNGKPSQYSWLGNPWIEESGRIQSLRLQRVGPDLVTKKQHIIGLTACSLDVLMWQISQDFPKFKILLPISQI